MTTGATYTQDDLTFDRDSSGSDVILGRGGYGQVCKASLVSTRKEVAVKLLNKRGDVCEEDIIKLTKSLEYEAKVMKNIPPECEEINEFHGVYMDTKDNVFGLVTAYQPNGSLHSFIDKVQVSCDIKTFWLMGVCEGMRFLHHNNIFHLDLKAKNILITKALKSKITDFGLSKMLHYTSSFSTSKNPGLGTSTHCAPERIPDGSARKKITANASNDIWSFGITVFEVMCQRHVHPRLPYSNTVDIVTSLRVHISTGISPISEDIIDQNIEPDCPEFLRKLMIKCCDMNPDKRPPFFEICREFQEKVDANFDENIRKECQTVAEVCKKNGMKGIVIELDDVQTKSKFECHEEQKSILPDQIKSKVQGKFLNQKCWIISPSKVVELIYQEINLPTHRQQDLRHLTPYDILCYLTNDEPMTVMAPYSIARLETFLRIVRSNTMKSVQTSLNELEEWLSWVFVTSEYNLYRIASTVTNVVALAAHLGLAHYKTEQTETDFPKDFDRIKMNLLIEWKRQQLGERDLMSLQKVAKELLKAFEHQPKSIKQQCEDFCKPWTFSTTTIAAIHLASSDSEDVSNDARPSKSALSAQQSSPYEADSDDVGKPTQAEQRDEPVKVVNDTKDTQSRRRPKASGSDTSHQSDAAEPSVESGQKSFEIGELVILESSKQKLKEVQNKFAEKGKTAWHTRMEKYAGNGGYVSSTSSSKVEVTFPNGKKLSFHPSLVKKSSITDFAGLAANTWFDSLPFKRFDIVEFVGGEHEGRFGVVRQVESDKPHKTTVEVYDSDKRIDVDPGNLRKVTQPFQLELEDVVLVTIDRRRAEQKQAGYGGWKPWMDEYLGTIGKVQTISRGHSRSGRAVCVIHKDDQKIHWNKELLTVVSKPGLSNDYYVDA